MGDVLGVSVGAGYVRLAHLRETGGPQLQSVAVRAAASPEELAAEAVGVVVAGAAEAGAAVTVGVAYRDEAQAAALDTALRRQGVEDFRLVPELTAIVEGLRQVGCLSEAGPFVVYDLGSSGVTVSVVDADGAALASERSTALCGDRIGDVSRETGDCRVDAEIAASAELVADLLAQTDTTPVAVVLVGGGVRGDAVRDGLAPHCAVPIVTPDRPEFTAATGAALLARPVSAAASAGQSLPGRSRSRVSMRTGLAGATLAALAVAGAGVAVFGSSAFRPADASSGTPGTGVPTAEPTSWQVTELPDDLPAPSTSDGAPLQSPARVDGAAARSAGPQPARPEPEVGQSLPAWPTLPQLPVDLQFPVELPQLPVGLPQLPVGLPPVPGAWPVRPPVDLPSDPPTEPPAELPTTPPVATTPPAPES